MMQPNGVVAVPIAHSVELRLKNRAVGASERSACACKRGRATMYRCVIADIGYGSGLRLRPLPPGPHPGAPPSPSCYNARSTLSSSILGRICVVCMCGPALSPSDHPLRPIHAPILIYLIGSPYVYACISGVPTTPTYSGSAGRQG